MLPLLGLGGTAAAAGMASLLGLFNYNHQSMTAECQNRQNMIHQLQQMRITQAGMYRQDLKDMFGAVDAKMMLLVLVASILIGVVFNILLQDIRVSAPVWTILWLGIHVCASLMYLGLALYFAVYASIAAVASMVRVLTQEVRLPIASADDVKYACVYMSEFESPRRVHELLRVPFLQTTQNRRKYGGVGWVELLTQKVFGVRDWQKTENGFYRNFLRLIGSDTPEGERTVAMRFDEKDRENNPYEFHPITKALLGEHHGLSATELNSAGGAAMLQGHSNARHTASKGGDLHLGTSQFELRRRTMAQMGAAALQHPPGRTAGVFQLPERAASPVHPINHQGIKQHIDYADHPDAPQFGDRSSLDGTLGRQQVAAVPKTQSQGRVMKQAELDPSNTTASVDSPSTHAAVHHLPVSASSSSQQQTNRPPRLPGKQLPSQARTSRSSAGTGIDQNPFSQPAFAHQEFRVSKGDRFDPYALDGTLPAKIRSRSKDREQMQPVVRRKDLGNKMLLEMVMSLPDDHVYPEHVLLRWRALHVGVIRQDALANAFAAEKMNGADAEDPALKHNPKHLRVHEHMNLLLPEAHVKTPDLTDCFHFKHYHDFDRRWGAFQKLARICVGLGTVEMFGALAAHIVVHIVKMRKLFFFGALIIFLLMTIQICLQKVEIASTRLLKLDGLLVLEQALTLAIVVGSEYEIQCERFAPLVFVVHIFYMKELMVFTPFLGSGPSFEYFRSAKAAEFFTRATIALETEAAAASVHMDKAEAKMSVHHAQEDLKEKTMDASTSTSSPAARNELHAVGELQNAAFRQRGMLGAGPMSRSELKSLKTRQDVLDLQRKRDSAEIRYLEEHDLTIEPSSGKEEMNYEKKTALKIDGNKTPATLQAPKSGGATSGALRSSNSKNTKRQVFTGAYALELRVERLLALFEHDYVTMQLDDPRLTAIRQARVAMEEAKMKLKMYFPSARRPAADSAGTAFNSNAPSRSPSRARRSTAFAEGSHAAEDAVLRSSSTAGRSSASSAPRQLRDSPSVLAALDNLNRDFEQVQYGAAGSGFKVRPMEVVDGIPATHSWVQLYFQGSRGMHLPYYVSPVLLRNSWLRPGDVPPETEYHIPSLLTLQVDARLFELEVENAVEKLQIEDPRASYSPRSPAPSFVEPEDLRPEPSSEENNHLVDGSHAMLVPVEDENDEHFWINNHGASTSVGTSGGPPQQQNNAIFPFPIGRIRSRLLVEERRRKLRKQKTSSHAGAPQDELLAHDRRDAVDVRERSRQQFRAMLLEGSHNTSVASGALNHEDEDLDVEQETPLPGRLFRLGTFAIFISWGLALIWSFFAYTIFLQHHSQYTGTGMGLSSSKAASRRTSARRALLSEELKDDDVAGSTGSTSSAFCLETDFSGGRRTKRLSRTCSFSSETNDKRLSPPRSSSNVDTAEEKERKQFPVAGTQARKSINTTPRPEHHDVSPSRVSIEALSVHLCDSQNGGNGKSKCRASELRAFAKYLRDEVDLFDDGLVTQAEIHRYLQSPTAQQSSLEGGEEQEHETRATADVRPRADDSENNRHDAAAAHMPLASWRKQLVVQLKNLVADRSQWPALALAARPFSTSKMKRRQSRAQARSLREI
ncbi:unnamed protein product [Amoebophrya sp. A120]|nr:unnamed protein product [Amoebophrya sp. A120]|eukprot:GSA120T00001511001.1